MHVGHEPYQLGILAEFQFPAGFPARDSRWYALLHVCERFRR
jgi:hypothetical protein